MVITLIKKDKVYSITLPKKIKGQYWIYDDDNGEHRSLVSIEGIADQWHLKSNRKNYIVGENGERLNDAILDDVKIYKLKICEEEAYIYTEPDSDSRQVFEKFVVEDGAEISIGRNKNNTICYSNRFVSGEHAGLVYYDGKWTISDKDSTNGTFVNEHKVTTRSLEPGDIIFIMGLKVIIGRNYLAFNNPDNMVAYDRNVLFDFVSQPIDENVDLSELETENKYYYRSPRFKRTVTHKVFKLDLPPNSPVVESVPMIFMIGPALTMGMASVSTAAFSIMNALSNGRGLVSALPSVIMAVSMLLGMILWPVLNKKFEKKKKLKEEKRRELAYRTYLQEMRDKILFEMSEQCDILNENNVTVEECAARIADTKPALWERTINQDDFLELRVGVGNLPLDADIVCVEKKFSVDSDYLQDELFAMVNEPKIIKNVPVTFSLKNIKVSGIVSRDRHALEKFVTNLIIRIVTLHSYDEVKLAFFVDKQKMESFKFAKWLPHVWDNDKSIRFFASDMGEAKEVSAYLEDRYAERLEKGKTENKKPYYVIFNIDNHISNKIGIINTVLKQTQKDEAGFSIVNVYDSIIALPKECDMVMDIDAKNSRIYDKNDISGKKIEFVPDISDNVEPEKLAIKEANTLLDLSTQVFNLPNVYTFLEMFNVEKIEYLNPLMRWKENNPCVSLATPIGIDTMGETFTLDLHEKYQGPHGLVAGMTGSGKSEFIITYILSLAVNYHPDEVAFILIDYKGGGLTGAFEYKDKGIVLPHLAGTITNLDGSAVKRSLISIQSELRRRQAVFNDARKVSNEGTMDIYKYQKLYREGVVKEPVPHLFIISDEFAELKSQQPEFMEQLISAARIGRSLGVHLILATQKPNGVVDDQIWSNTRFRVCLKVSDKADSNDMIKRPDAAELSNTGRFYLQVGFNELFAMGQSAWCGAPYDENAGAATEVQNSIQVIDNIGRVVKEVKSAKKNKGKDNLPKQSVEVVKYLSELAKEEGIAVRKLWMEPIPAVVWTQGLMEKYGFKTCDTYKLNPVVGELDDPFNQTQRILTLPLSEEGNTVIYGVAGSGKLTFITTMMYELIRTHSAKNLNIYALDFGAETLKAFEKAPQVGGIVLSNESERVINLFKMLRREIEFRKKLFTEYGGDFEMYIQNSGKTLPGIVVIINNYAAFSEMYEECYDIFANLTREGTKYGMYFVITATNTGEVRYKVLQNFKQYFVLQLNDKSDYSGILGLVEGTYPSKIKGRGIIKTDHTYEFQTAYVSEHGTEMSDITELCEEVYRQNSDTPAPKIPVLPDRVDAGFLSDDKFTLARLPVGVDRKNLDIIRTNLFNTYISFALAQSTENVSSYAQGISEIISSKGILVKTVDSENIFAVDENKQYEYCNNEPEQYVVDMFNDVVARFQYNKANGNADVFDNVVYVINSMSQLRKKLSADGIDKLQLVLLKGSEKLKVNVVICDSYPLLNKASGEEWYRNCSATASGVWIGDGVSDQYLLKIGKMNTELYKEVESGFGYYINRGRYIPIKVLSSRYAAGEEAVDG